MKIEQINKLVRNQIIYHIQEDLNGGEGLMKEVWEALETDADFGAAHTEMKRIIEAIKTLK